MKKRFLSILMAAAMVLSLLPASALAAEGTGQDTVAIVRTSGGQETGYDTLNKAMQAATAGSTVVLQQDVTVTSKSATKNFGVTVDLNGYNIDGGALSATTPALELRTNYNSKPVEGVDSTIRLINSKAPEGGSVTAKLPVRFKAGDSSKPVSGVIGDGVNLVVLDGGVTAVELESGAYLPYSETTAKYVSNGGFRVPADGQDRIYGSYANATKVAEGNTITMLNDYTGSDPIKSGNATSTLDLNDKTYTYTGTERIAEINYDNVGLTLMNGTLECEQSNVDGIHMLYSNTSLTLDNVTIDASGSYGIVTNGQETGNSITLKHSALTAENGSGIYFPSTGNVAIENSEVSAKNVGVQMCAGSLTVKGEQTTITATGTPLEKTENDGVIPDAAAVSIVERDGYQDLGAVAIEAGTFEAAESSKAVKAYAFNNTNKTEDEWAGASEVITITGGTFSSDVSDYIPENYIQNEDGTVAQLGADNAVAQVGDSYYATLSEAFSKASGGDTVKVLSNTDISGSKVSVPSDKSLTLDLNGKEVQAANNGNIFVSGKLTICDTSDGAQGTIRATQKYGESYTGGIVVASGENALLTMESGNIVASGFDDPKNNGQFGVMVQGGGDFTMTGGKIEAGWYAAAGNGNDETTNSVINIQGGELISTADYALYLPQSGTTTISGGTIRGAAGGISIQRGTLTINSNNALITSLGTGDTGDWGDGTGGQDPAALNIAAEYGNTSVTISAGKFIAEQKDLFIKAPSTYTVSLAITGGYYSNDPSEYVAEGLAALPGEYVVDGVTYPYTVGKALPEAVEVATGKTEVTAPEGIDENVVDQVKGTTASGLSKSANDEAATLPEANKANKDAYNAAVDELNKQLGEGATVPAANSESITTIIAPRLDIEIKDYDDGSETGENKSLTLDIEAVYDIKATKATDGDELIEYDEETSGVSTVNTVTIQKNAGTLNTTGTDVKISIPLPNGFVSDASTPVYVQHKGYEYNTTVTGDNDNGYTATFTNPHGFSTFTISTKSQTVATVNGDSYTNFQDAVNAAPNGATITIPSGASVPTEGLSATISGSAGKSVKVKNETGDKITVTINGVKQEIANGLTSDVFTYTPSHGGSSGSSGYAITVPSNIKNGDVTVSPSRATAGTVVTITVKPDAGYELDSLTVTDKNGETVALKDIGNNKYTFTMPSGAVKIAAEFVEETPVSTLPFDDVAATAWYYDAVEYVYDNGLMNGTASDTFAPNATLTRGMLATVLWRMEGSPVVNYALPFEDVSGDQWYTEAIRWAASVGVVNGTSATTYAPNANITREQLATMLYRYAAYKSGSVSTSASLSGFTDAGSVSDYAADAMEWAVAEEIIGGMTSTTLVPQGSATRAQTATMLMRYCENVL